VATPTELLWALIGLILTIGGTFLEGFVTNPPWAWAGNGFHTYSLGVTFQVGAVLLTGCMGGKKAGLIAQMAYLLLGLTWLDVFTQGGGLDYITRPTFGYLLGFIPGAWVCGFLAFKVPTRLESLAFSCLGGLLVIHLTGMVYLAIARGLQWVDLAQSSLWDTILVYSIYPFPGHLAIVCAVTVIAFFLRSVMFY
jgi:biotin transport system substrate-specific component